MEIKKAKSEKRLSNQQKLNAVDISVYSKQYIACEDELETLMHKWEKISSEIQSLVE